MKKKNPLLVVLLVLLLVVGGVGAYYFLVINNEKISAAYLANDRNEVKVFDENEEEYSFYRGQLIDLSDKKKTINDKEYSKFYIDDKVYYVLDKYVVSSVDDCVFEKELWAYRTCTVYKDDSSSKIAGVLEKGEKIEVIGHTPVLADGSVERYAYKDGYVLDKYLTYDEGYARSYPDVSFINDTENAYGAGSASTLDYYGNEKISFDNNVMPDECRTLYINGESCEKIDEYIALAKETGANAFVIDIRDSHIVTFASEVMKEYSPSSYNAALMSKEAFKEIVAKANDAGIYTIGRITVFKDVNFMNDHPEYAILDETENNSPFLYGGSYWPSAFVREVWEYNVELSKEAVVDLGFKEIEYDYVRFPEQIDYFADIVGTLDLQNKYNETRSEAIQRFLMYAVDEIHKVGAYVSADVFGETTNTYVCAYGQFWPAISSVVDVISPMPYPDHFAPHDYGIASVVWEVPYQLLSIWGSNAYKRQQETPTPARIRTYLQGYDAIYEPYVPYDNQKLKDQIDALKDSGIYDNGYIIWNAGSNLIKYSSYSEAIKNS